MINFFLIILYLIAIVFGVFIILLVLDFNVLSICLRDKAPLLGAFGIIISAFIASLSVLKNIENTNKLEDKRVARKIKSLVRSLILILQRINLIDYSINNTENLPIDEKNKAILLLYKTYFPYLVKSRDVILSEDYSAYIDDYENYILLLEIIGTIDDHSSIFDVVGNINIEKHEGIEDSIKNLIGELKSKCHVLIDFYK